MDLCSFALMLLLQGSLVGQLPLLVEEDYESKLHLYSLETTHYNENILVRNMIVITKNKVKIDECGYLLGMKIRGKERLCIWKILK